MFIITSIKARSSEEKASVTGEAGAAINTRRYMGPRRDYSKLIPGFLLSTRDALVRICTSSGQSPEPFAQEGSVADSKVSTRVGKHRPVRTFLDNVAGSAIIVAHAKAS